MKQHFVNATSWALHSRDTTPGEAPSSDDTTIVQREEGSLEAALHASVHHWDPEQTQHTLSLGGQVRVLETP